MSSSAAAVVAVQMRTLNSFGGMNDFLRTDALVQSIAEPIFIADFERSSEGENASEKVAACRDFMFAIVITATALARAEGPSMDFARGDGEAISFGEIEKLIGAGVHSGVDLYA